MVALSQLSPNLGLGFQPPPPTKSSRPSAAAAASAAALSRRIFNIPASSPQLPRFSYGANFLLKKKTFHAPFASNSEGVKSIQGKATDSSSSNETKTTPQGPPFLTIVAGVIVFFLVCWVVWSFAIWLVSPIVNLFISK